MSDDHARRHRLLSQKLTSYARGMDRRQILRTLTAAKNANGLFPKMYELKSAVVEDIAMAEREAAQERGILNGVKFMQGGKNLVGMKPEDFKRPLRMDSYFLQTIREVCGHMCDMDGVYADSMALYGGLLLRLSRAVSERDALEVVTKWLGGKELVVLPLKRWHHYLDFYNNASVTSSSSGGTSDLIAKSHINSLRLAQPVDVEIFIESGNVHSKVCMGHEFGLYRKADLESHGMGQYLLEWETLTSQTPSSYTTQKIQSIQYQLLASQKSGTCLKPWIYIDAEVVERINFGSGNSVRLLYVNVPERKNSGYAVIS